MPYNINACIKQIKKVMKEIEDNIYIKTGDLTAEAYVTNEPVTYDHRFSGEKKSLKIGQSWGSLFDCAWFHFTGDMPISVKDEKTVLIIDINGEAYVADKDGNPVQGITTKSSEYDFSLGQPVKKVVYLTDDMIRNDKVDVWADGACNDLFGNYRNNGVLIECHIAVMNELYKELYYDYEVLFELMNQLSPDSARYYSILYALYHASNIFSFFTDDEALKAKEILYPELNRRCVDSPLTISAIGHAHLDLAWRWPIRESIRKGARTFATALMNLDKYPDYVFGASQPQLYQWMKDSYPVLYDRVKKNIVEGRWEAQGAMWVESDTNITGGESLVRQVVYGKTFYREEFGIDVKTLWLPDVFGYSAALPQILKKSGVDYFMTIKLSWSEFNAFPHHTFWWEGLDGSKVLTHMPPEGNYNSSGAPRAVKAIEKSFLDKGISDEALLLFGIGDGGGGPGEEHIERLMREKQLQGLLPVTQEFSQHFFDRIVKNGEKYQTWAGELYLEYHRGTYTTQGRSKLYNRKIEVALRELELACAETGSTDYLAEINLIWKEVLLYQFHDILPGSSITRVYEESHQRYEVLQKRIEEMTASLRNEPSMNNQYVKLYNSLSWERKKWIEYDGKWKYVTIPPMGYIIKKFDETDRNHFVKACDDSIENELLKVVFNSNGTIKSIYDKENSRETVKEGFAANQFGFYLDDGDAWDFPYDYELRTVGENKLVKLECTTEGPMAVCHLEFEYGKSIISQKIVLMSLSRRVDFHTQLNWNDHNIMMRTYFPVAVSSDNVTCEIQFGNIKRPTHKNTSWDMAKFEVCAHKWADLSQRDYGVSLLNDSKYGYSVSNDTFNLALLRSPEKADKKPEQGIHTFTYSYYPHAGDYVTGNTVYEGYDLNIPVHKYSTGLEAENISHSLIRVAHQNIVIETVKTAEDRTGMVVRMYESSGAMTITDVRLANQAETVFDVNLMEDISGVIEKDCEMFQLTFEPYEIRTIKIIRKG
ncbi:MAG: alpha-mannosidase [Clostridia bacterium]|nr:alpha-mannosidase [Clostridia bacterium]